MPRHHPERMTRPDAGARPAWTMAERGSGGRSPHLRELQLAIKSAVGADREPCDTGRREAPIVPVRGSRCGPMEKTHSFPDGPDRHVMQTGRPGMELRRRRQVRRVAHRARGAKSGAATGRIPHGAFLIRVAAPCRAGDDGPPEAFSVGDELGVPQAIRQHPLGEPERLGPRTRRWPNHSADSYKAARRREVSPRASAPNMRILRKTCRFRRQQRPGAQPAVRAAPLPRRGR